MSLLTNEQIAELACIASNQSTGRDLHDEFREWNEKQTGAQVIIDWSRAPEYVVAASIGFAWVNEKGLYALGQTLKKLYKPEPVITPHPHAEIIMKYAKVAARRIDPWVEFAYRRNINDDWKKLDNYPAFGITYEYRHIGDKK